MPTVSYLSHSNITELTDTVSLSNQNIQDPLLSVLGVQMSLELRQILEADMSPAMDSHLILTSPLRRATQTAWYTFYPEFQEHLSLGGKYGCEIRPTSRLQPITSHPCDTGMATNLLRQELPEIDWDSLALTWPNKTELDQWNKWAVDQRTVAVKNLLRAEGEHHSIITVISHYDFLLALTGKKFAPADYRVFEFSEDSYDDADTGGKLIEWAETEKPGGGMGLSPHGEFGIDELTFPTLSQEEQAEIDRKFELKNNCVKWRQESIQVVSKALDVVGVFGGWFIKKNVKNLKIDAIAAQFYSYEALNYVDEATEFLNPFADDLGRGNGRAYRGEWE